MNAMMDEDRRDERLAGLMAGMLGGEPPGNILRLAPEQQLRRRWPLAIAAAGAVTLVVLLIAGGVLYWRASPTDVDRAARPVVQSVPGAAPPPKAFVAIAPPPPAVSVRRHARVRPAVERRRAVAPRPRYAPWSRDFAPAEEAYGPYPDVPLGRAMPGRGLADDRRRMRERDFAPADEAYGPYPAVPLSADALRRVLVDDRRRTRELNNRELRSLPEP